MKKIILTGAIMVALIGSLSLQSCNSEKKADATDSTSVTTTKTESITIDSSKVMSSKMADSTDTGGKGTLAPPPKK